MIHDNDNHTVVLGAEDGTDTGGFTKLEPKWLRKMMMVDDAGRWILMTMLMMMMMISYDLDNDDDT